MERVAVDLFLRRLMKQTLSDMVGARKRTTQERLSSLLLYDLVVTGTRAEEGTKLEKKLRYQMNEAEVELGKGSKGDVFCAWRLKQIEHIAYSE